MLLDCKFETVSVAVHTDADDILRGSGGLSFSPKTVFSGLIYAFACEDAFLDGFGGRVDEAETSPVGSAYDGWEETIKAI